MAASTEREHGVDGGAAGVSGRAAGINRLSKAPNGDRLRLRPAPRDARERAVRHRLGGRRPRAEHKGEDARKHYEIEGLEEAAELDSDKIMPRPDLGQAVARLQVTGNRVDVAGTFRLTGADRRPVSGLPVPEGPHARSEPALDMEVSRRIRAGSTPRESPLSPTAASERGTNPARLCPPRCGRDGC